jgi:membrane-associated phospholipid phosphatase
VTIPSIRWPHAVGAAAVVVVGLIPFDRSITSAVVDARTPARDDVALLVSRFGSTPVVVGVTVLLAALAWPRSRRLALAVVVVALARPLFEFTVKELIDRPRPAGDRLVPGRGPSFPSGHPMAVAASWGLVPFVVARWSSARGAVRAATIAGFCLIPAVAASRLWLGVHWASDAFAGAVLGTAGLLVAGRWLRRVA